MSTVLVCGGRDYGDWRTLASTLDAVRPSKIVTGCANGADGLAREWARRNCVPLAVHEADWNRLGRAAGPERNQRMIESERIDLVLAFPGGRGTADMTARALKAGVPTLDVRADHTTATRREQDSDPQTGMDA